MSASSRESVPSRVVNSTETLSAVGASLSMTYFTMPLLATDPLHPSREIAIVTVTAHLAAHQII
ncbi:hypothetical protein [Paenibacillus paeoniae]|uniref:hypothetical protein n=1 Tax=Paenibacillus paeoniae TaxID=2292705 RepID=UPI001058A14E|nr:hypothetical protein [Paenibacillus paeoniae]